jgi:hypothetical protein
VINETIFDHDPMKCDGVGEWQTERCAPVDYEHEQEHRFAEHEYETGQEPEQVDARAGPIVRGSVRLHLADASPGLILADASGGCDSA